MPDKLKIEQLGNVCLPCRQCDNIIGFEPSFPMQYLNEGLFARLVFKAPDYIQVEKDT